MHCVAHPLALVAAETPDAAREAAGLVTADWTPLPAVVDAADATELIGPVRTLACGNVEANLRIDHGLIDRLDFTGDFLFDTPAEELSV